MPLMFWNWHAPVWLGRRCRVWRSVALIRFWRFTNASHVNWRRTFCVFELFCVVDSCWPHSTELIQRPLLQICGIAKVAVQIKIVIWSDIPWYADRGWELGYIPATSFLPAKCVGQAQNVRVSVCVCACPSRWIRSNCHDMFESLRLVSCLAIHLQPWCLNDVECVLFVCVLSHSYSDDILWFTIFYYSLDALLNTIWYYLNSLNSVSLICLFRFISTCFCGSRIGILGNHLQLLNMSIMQFVGWMEWFFLWGLWRIVPNCTVNCTTTEMHTELWIEFTFRISSFSSRDPSISTRHPGFLMVSPHGWSEKSIYGWGFNKLIINIYYILYGHLIWSLIHLSIYIIFIEALN